MRAGKWLRAANAFQKARLHYEPALMNIPKSSGPPEGRLTCSVGTNCSGVTYVRAGFLPSDELEPCLRNGMSASMVSSHGHVPLNGAQKSWSRGRDSFVTDRQVHRPKKDHCMRKCVLCLLLHGIFVFCVFLAFLIGHWASDVEFGNDTFLLASINRLNANLTVTLLSSTSLPATPDDAASNTNPIQRLPPRNITLSEVYPPNRDVQSRIGFVHRSPRRHPSSVDEQLPSYLTPLHYDIKLDLTEVISAEHIRGNVTILFESSANYTQREIVLHATPNIFIQKLELYHDQKTLKLGEVKRVFNKDQVKVTVAEALKAKWYKLNVQFRTKLCVSSSRGVHCIRRSLIRNDNSTTVHKVVGFTTKFEPNLARTFLPCLDTPTVKTTFNVTARHPADLTVLSNSATADEFDEMGPVRGSPMNKISVFRETPRMAIYLLAFAMTDFTPLELRTERNLPLTIWSDPQKMAAVHFAAKFVTDIFDRVERDLEVQYPLPKLDVVLTPNYPVGGMENWGLIIFQEEAILLSSNILDEQNMTVDRLAEEYKIEKIITHEIVHQWFGNLVTMADWSNLWLNEGFATYFAFDYLNVDHSYLTDNEYYMQLIDLMRSQTSNTPSSLVQPVEDLRAISKMFDQTNVYTKGSVVIKMIKDLLGVEQFRAGVIKFLKENAYKAVERAALWEALPVYADHGVEEERLADVMEGWLENTGMPEVIVTRNYEDQTIRITQRTADVNNYIIYLNENDTATSPSTSFILKRSASVTRMAHRVSTFNDSLFSVQATTTTARPKKRKQRRNRQNHRRRSRTSKMSVFGDTKLGDRSKNRPTEIGGQVLVQREHRRRRVNDRNSQLWSVPFSYSFGSVRSTSGQTVRQFWLHNETIRFVDLGLQSYQHLLVNPHWIYPYKVNYDLDNWKLLINQLHRDHSAIPVMSRMQLLVDADTYLKQSGVPHLFIKLLGYLAKEEDLGVLLAGLDNLHSLVDMVSGTNLVGPLLVHLNAVIQQMDRLLLQTASNPETASIWLLSPRRLAKLYQLRCVANMPSCEQNRQMAQWMSHPTALDPSHHQEITAVCHYLFTQAGPSELSMLMGLLKLRSGQWSVNIHLATCVRDDSLIQSVVDKIIKTKNAAVYLSVLQTSYTVQYNRRFRELFWRGIGHLSLHERQLLFAVNTGLSDEIGRHLMHAARSVDEIDAIESLLPEWPQNLQIHLQYLRRRMAWLQDTAVKQMHQFLIEEVE